MDSSSFQTKCSWQGLLSTDCRFLQGMFTCSTVELSSSMGCRGTACSITSFSRGCRRTSAPASGAPLPSPSSLTLVSAGLVLQMFHTPLSHTAAAPCFFTLHKYVITEMPPVLLRGSGLSSSRSFLEPAGNVSGPHGDNSWFLLRETTPVALSATKVVQHKPNAFLLRLQKSIWLAMWWSSRTLLKILEI